MIVLFKNSLWNLDIPFSLFENFKISSPETKVEILEMTQSSYKRQLRVSVKELEDYSIARNLNALKATHKKPPS